MADQTLQTLHSFLKRNETKVSSGGRVVSYSHDHGSGPILCMIHGWPETSYMWRHTISLFKDQISLFIPELPGYGISSLPPASDKRTVGKLLMEALQTVFSPSTRPVIICGHDRGGRIGHRLLVDDSQQHHLLAAVLIDIVPTTAQWESFARPGAAVAYFHWPFLAHPAGPMLIEAMGGQAFCRTVLTGQTKGLNPQGVARFRADEAVDHYAHNFHNPETIAGSCADYAAGATTDVEEQGRDREAGRTIGTPTLVLYSAANLGKMHDVKAAWAGWASGEFEAVGIEGGHGHFLPEECPEKVAELVSAFIKKHAS